MTGHAHMPASAAACQRGVHRAMTRNGAKTATVFASLAIFENAEVA
jgi:hypothetical protein